MVPQAWDILFSWEKYQQKKKSGRCCNMIVYECCVTKNKALAMNGRTNVDGDDDDDDDNKSRADGNSSTRIMGINHHKRTFLVCFHCWLEHSSWSLRMWVGDNIVVTEDEEMLNVGLRVECGKLIFFRRRYQSKKERTWEGEMMRKMVIKNFQLFQVFHFFLSALLPPLMPTHLWFFSLNSIYFIVF